MESLFNILSEGAFHWEAKERSSHSFSKSFHETKHCLDSLLCADKAVWNMILTMQTTQKHKTSMKPNKALLTCVLAVPSVALPPLAFRGSIIRRGETFSPRISLIGRTIGGLEL